MDLKNELLKEGYKIGCFDAKLNKLDDEEVKKVIERVTSNSVEDYSDMLVRIDGEYFALEICHVDVSYDNVERYELDLNLLGLQEYGNRYGNELLNSLKERCMK